MRSFVNSSSALYQVRNGNLFYAYVQEGSSFKKYIQITTPQNTLPQIGQYYESVGPGNATGLVSSYNINAAGAFSLISCKSTETKRTGYKIIQQQNVSPRGPLVLEYFITCSGTSSNSNRLDVNTVEGRVLYYPSATVSPFETEVAKARLESATTKNNQSIYQQNGVSWFQKYANRMFP
jgi:hypothetical protein